MEAKMIEELIKCYNEMISLTSELEYLNGRLHAAQVCLENEKYLNTLTIAKMVGIPIVEKEE